MPYAIGENKITCEADTKCGQPGELFIVKGDMETGEEYQLYYCEYHRAKHILKMERIR